MTSQILAALDGSRHAESVLPDAVSMVRATASELILLRAVPMPTYIEPLGGIAPQAIDIWETWQDELKVARSYLEGIAENLRLVGLRVRTVALEGDPASCILDYLSVKPDVRLVAIATHARKGVSRWIFGSVAEQVLHSSSVPLLMVHTVHSTRAHNPAPQELITDGRTYESIMVPLDGSRFAEQALERAQELASGINGQITLISVVPPLGTWERNIAPAGPPWLEAQQQTRFDQMQDYLLGAAQRLRAEGYKVKTMVEEGHPAETIIRAADYTGADLIVMTTHSRIGIERMWLGSVAIEVVQGTTKPVILERPKERVKEGVTKKLEEETAHKTPLSASLPALTPIG